MSSPLPPGKPFAAALAWALAGAILFLPSLALPLVNAEKFGERHSGYLTSGILSLWADGHWLLSAMVFLFGLLAPITLSVLLSLSLWELNRASRPARHSRWLHLVRHLEPWSMPEVQMLGIIVAFLKLSALVPSQPAAGLWCYGASAGCTVVAWRLFLATEKKIGNSTAKPVLSS